MTHSFAETMLVVGISLLAIAGAATLSTSPGAVASSSVVLPPLFDEARALAATSGDGATILLRPGTSSGTTRSFEVAIYRGRPRPGGSFDSANPARTERLAGILSTSLAAGGPIAIFISTAGTVSYALWSPSDGSLPQEPVCSAPMVLILSGTARFQLSCSDARPTRL